MVDAFLLLVDTREGRQTSSFTLLPLRLATSPLFSLSQSGIASICALRDSVFYFSRIEGRPPASACMLDPISSPFPLPPLSFSEASRTRRTENASLVASHESSRSRNLLVPISWQQDKQASLPQSLLLFFSTFIYVLHTGLLEVSNQGAP